MVWLTVVTDFCLCLLIWFTYCWFFTWCVCLRAVFCEFGLIVWFVGCCWLLFYLLLVDWLIIYLTLFGCGFVFMMMLCLFLIVLWWIFLFFVYSLFAYLWFLFFGFGFTYCVVLCLCWLIIACCLFGWGGFGLVCNWVCLFVILVLVFDTFAFVLLFGVEVI